MSREGLLFRIWTVVVVTLGMGLVWEPDAPRFLWGMFAGSLVCLFSLFLSWVVRKKK